MLKEISDKTDAELEAEARNCLAQLETAGGSDRPALLLEAQIYLREVDRRGENWIARRDLILEVIVIVLIIAEVGIAAWEGKEQDKILADMNTNIAATATTIGNVQTVEQQVLEQQIQSVDSLKHMNGELQTSLKETRSMAAAATQQLKVLQDEQASRLAQQAKKPKLELDNFDGNTAINLNTQTPAPLKLRERTETKTTFIVALRNLGDDAARHGTLRVIVYSKDVQLEFSSPFQKLFEEPDTPVHVFLVSFDVVRQGGGAIPMLVTANYPKGAVAFAIEFNVDADEIPTATYLGRVVIVPPQPSN
jgi:hypothetical protein